MLEGIYAELLEAVEIDVLDIYGGRLEYHLELVVVLEPVRVFPIPPVGGPS